MRIHALVNYPVAMPGFIQDWAKDREYSLSTTFVFDGEAFPDKNDLDMLVILGGTMGAYEEDKYPWLKDEKKFIKECIDNDKYVLGICLGSQLIAEVLGGKVFPHEHKEIGWHDIQLTSAGKAYFPQLPQQLTFFQYHGDTFTLPHGTELLASNSCCANQAYRYGDKVLAFQFHPEFNTNILQEVVQKFSKDIEKESGPFVQSADEFINEKFISDAKEKFFYMLDTFVNQ